MLTSPCYVDSFFHFCHSFNLSPSSFHAISSSAPLEKTALSIVDYRPTKIAPSSFVMPARLLLFLHRSSYECNPSRLRFPASHPTWEGPRQTRLIFRQFSEASRLGRYLCAQKTAQPFIAFLSLTSLPAAATACKGLVHKWLPQIIFKTLSLVYHQTHATNL